MELKPLGERIVVRRDSAEETTDSGIVIKTEKQQETAKFGEVLAIGEGVGFVKVGDRILWARYSGTEIPDLEEYRNCLLMNEMEILAKIGDSNG